MHITTLPELLAPAGSMEGVFAAVNNGCDAVYLGGKSFSARASAQNFSLQELEEVCDYCHLRNVRVYVTINILTKDTELPALLEWVTSLYNMGVDALIVQDVGVAALLHTHFPDFPLHASTQMTVHHWKDTLFLQEAGFSRVVPSRELSLEELQEMREHTELPLETFVHGALCVSYSGQCLMSSLLGGRSGNRGRCAQPCRLPYTLLQGGEAVSSGYLLSPKDLETLSLLPDFMEAGIASLKIEGRMKHPEYVAGVTQLYRKYLDSYATDPTGYQIAAQDHKKLLQLFNRGGFTKGYSTTFGGRTMIAEDSPKPWGVKAGFIDSYHAKSQIASIRTREPFVPGDGIEVWTDELPHSGTGVAKASRAGEVIRLKLSGKIAPNQPVYKTYDKALMDDLKKTWERDTRQQGIFARLRAKLEKPMSLELWTNSGILVHVAGETPEKAQKQPLTEATLRKQMEKTGNTPFYLESLEIDMDLDIFVSAGQLNALRRDAITALEGQIQKQKKHTTSVPVYLPKPPSPALLHKKLHVLVRTEAQLEAVMNSSGVQKLYIESFPNLEKILENAAKECHNKGIEVFLALPRIDRAAFGTSPLWDLAETVHADGFLVRTMGQLMHASKTGKKVTTDFSLHTFNQKAVQFWLDHGADCVTVSPELQLAELVNMANAQCEMLVYGYLPLMITQQCPIGNFAGERTDGRFCKNRFDERQYTLKDRKGEHFSLTPDCNACLCTIWNAKPLFLLKFYDEIVNSPTGSVRLEFTMENAQETEKILAAYEKMTAHWATPDPDVKLLCEEMRKKGSTRGHFFRGVE